MNSFLLSALSLIGLLCLSCATYFLAKRIRLPYTVTLVAIGMAIALVAKYVPSVSFITDFHLTPEILLYVFLPILLFESAYNMSYRELMRNIRSVSLLAVVSLIVSAAIIGVSLSWVGWLLGFPIPLPIALLFGALISATDPVAVLALFKELGAPRRLTLIFEGESLFNDGTALALFLVLLDIIFFLSGSDAWHGNSLFLHAFSHFTPSIGLSIVQGFFSFVSMIFVGIAFWGFVGWSFAKIIGKIQNEKFLEIALTLSLAHLAFIGAEIVGHFITPTSGVIATTIAALVMGNYGRYKISPKVEEIMGEFWEFFAFIANSLVFILIGILLVSLVVPWKTMFVPTIAAIVIVMAARAISVYGILVPFNWWKKEEHIPMVWQHLLSWGSLRGALAVIMVLLVPKDLHYPGWTLDISIQQFLLALTVGCVSFTLFLKAPTILPIMRKFRVDAPHDLENLSRIETTIFLSVESLAKIAKLKERGYLHERSFQKLHSYYHAQLESARKEFDAFESIHKKDIGEILTKNLSIHALGIERFYIKELHTYNEVDDETFQTLMRKNERQMERVSLGESQLKTMPTDKNLSDEPTDISESSILERYMLVRARQVTAHKVLKELRHFEWIDFLYGRAEFQSIIDLYSSFHARAKTERDQLIAENEWLTTSFDSVLAEKSILKMGEAFVDEFTQKGILTPKMKAVFSHDIEDRLYSMR